MRFLLFLTIILFFPYVIYLFWSKYKAKISIINTKIITKEKPILAHDNFIFAKSIRDHLPIILSHQELNTHLFVNGTTGSGKTVAFMNFVAEACEKNLPLIYLDGKGSVDLVDLIGSLAKKYNRVFRVFTIKPDVIDNPAHYDFLGSGTFTEKKNRIMKLFINASDAGSAYYQDRVERFVNSVFRLIKIHNLSYDLTKFMLLIKNNKNLLEVANLTKDEELIEYFRWVAQQKKDNPRDRILDLLDVFINSSYGHLFRLKDSITKEPIINMINLKQSISNNEIVLFLLDSSAYYMDTSKIAKMVISDINSTFAEFGEVRPRQFKKTFCIFDEFASYATDALSATISLHRSNGMHAFIGTQSITTVAEVSIETKRVAEELLSCCNTFLVLATTNDKDALRLAKIFGTKKRLDFSWQIKDKDYSIVSNRQVEDYIVSPQSIKDIPLNRGIGYIYRKAVGVNPIKIQVYPNHTLNLE